MFLKRQRKEGDPERAGEAWNDTEEEQLLQEINQGKTIDEIRACHHRSIGAIQARKVVIAARMIEQDEKDMTEVMNMMDIPEQELVRYLQQKDKKKDRRTQPSLYELLHENNKMLREIKSILGA